MSGTLPARLNGSPINNLSDINVSATRNVNQRATVTSIKLQKGKLKGQFDLTFVVDDELLPVLAAMGWDDDDAEPFSLQVDMARGTINLINGAVNAVNITGDQDGKAECKVSVVVEKVKRVL